MCSEGVYTGECYYGLSMRSNYIRLVTNSLLIAVIGVFGIDYVSHLLFSNPMETIPYFLAKMTAYILFSALFLSVISVQKNEFWKVLAGGIVVASLWGAYYNVLPILFDYYPFGIPLEGLTFLGMGLLGTGIAFGTVHTLAFMGGYYVTLAVRNRAGKDIVQL